MKSLYRRLRQISGVDSNLSIPEMVNKILSKDSQTSEELYILTKLGHRDVLNNDRYAIACLCYEDFLSVNWSIVDQITRSLLHTRYDAMRTGIPLHFRDQFEDFMRSRDPTPCYSETACIMYYLNNALFRKIYPHYGTLNEIDWINKKDIRPEILLMFENYEYVDENEESSSEQDFENDEVIEASWMSLFTNFIENVSA